MPPDSLFLFHCSTRESHYESTALFVFSFIRFFVPSFVRTISTERSIRTIYEPLRYYLSSHLDDYKRCVLVVSRVLVPGSWGKSIHAGNLTFLPPVH